MQGEASQPQTFFILSFDRESSEEEKKNQRKADDIIHFLKEYKDRSEKIKELESKWPGIFKEKNSRLF